MNTNTNASRAEVLVTGATGFIGRWLVAALTRRGYHVAALVRGAAGREEGLERFVERLGGDGTKLAVVDGDVEQPGLGLREDLPHVRIVYHLAARFAFGLRPEDARRTNVDGTRNAIEWASERPSLERFVFLGGYRMTKADPGPMSAGTLREAYAGGAYEGSKHEAFAVFHSLARARGVPWTAVHPSALIGDSRTGETMQTVGLGDTIKRLFQGKLPALAGSPRTFVPVVTVDFLADYLATVPLRAESAGKDLVVFDPASPPLRELVAIAARHMGVSAPRRTLPIGLLRALPSSWTGIDREGLSFLSEDRYDTTEGDAHAAALGLSHPPLTRAIERWCDYLVATRFLEQTAPPVDARAHGRFIGGTFTVGEPDEAEIVLLHGIPFDSEAMAPLAHRLGRTTARVDLPGLGRSAPSSRDARGFLSGVLAGRGDPVVVVGHSLGAGVAVDRAARHPETVSALVLIAPAFLTAPAPWTLRLRALVAFMLGRMGPRDLERRFLANGDPSMTHDAAVSASAALARSGGPRRTADALADATYAPRRAELREALRTVAARGVPILIVHARREPLVHDVDGAQIVCIDDAEHNPHLTHTDVVAAAVRTFLAACAPGSPLRE